MAHSALAAQGPGTAGAPALSFVAGTRAASLGSAYTAVAGDADGIFHNPASIAAVERGVGLGYVRYVEEISLAHASAAGRVGRFGLGVGVMYLDAGRIAEVVPDPAFRGERGRETGATVGATESAARIALGVPFLGRRGSAGVAIGIFTGDLAGLQRRATFADFGAQWDAGALDLGAALRNVALGADAGGVPLPTESRIGAAYTRIITEGIKGVISGDFIVGVKEDAIGFALGGETELRPGPQDFTMVLRAGGVLGERSDLDGIRLGGGIGLRALAVDYAVMAMRDLGMIHRVGVRWAR